MSKDVVLDLAGQTLGSAISASFDVPCINGVGGSLLSPAALAPRTVKPGGLIGEVAMRRPGYHRRFALRRRDVRLNFGEVLPPHSMTKDATAQSRNRAVSVR